MSTPSNSPVTGKTVGVTVSNLTKKYGRTAVGFCQMGNRDAESFARDGGFGGSGHGDQSSALVTK